MKLIKPHHEIIEQQSREIGMLKHIETCGRVAWKSEDRTTEDSYIKFIDMLKGVNHGSVLEHGTVYLYFTAQMFDSLYERYNENKYSILNNPHGYSCYVTTNYRVLVENNWLDDLKYQCEPTEFHEKRITVRFVCDRGVSHEYVRHRTFSFTQESTRYCNYSKDKFGNELVFIEPLWFNTKNIISYTNENNSSLISKHEESEFPNVLYELEIEKINKDTKEKILWSAEDWFIHNLKTSELSYFKMLNQGWKQQQARAVLPNSLKTELIMTGFISDWKHFFSLRTAVGAHPQAQELAIPLQEEFKRLNLI